MSQARQWARRLAPYVISGVVIAMILHEFSWSRIASELTRGDALAMLPLAFAMVFVSLFFVSLADHAVFAGTVRRAPRWWRVLAAKAATSLLDIVGYAVGHGSYAVWLARTSTIAPAHAGGALLYVMATDLAAVCTVATGATLMFGADGAEQVAVAAPIVAAVLITLILTGPAQLLGPPPLVFSPWAHIRARRAMFQLGIRVGQISMFVVVTWLGMSAFGMNVPLTAVATVLPVVLVVGALPINVGGFGAVQGAWLLFTPWAEGAEILAFQILWQLASTAAIVTRGLPFVRGFVDEIERGSAESTSASMPDTAPAEG